MSDLLWKPDKETYANSAIKNFSDNISKNYGIQIDRYQDLWQWSINEKEKFWSTLLQFLGISYSG